MNRLKFFSFATVFSLAMATLPLSAAEIFVCEDGSSVRVEVGQLESMKRTNDCVASHYGLKVSQNAAELVIAEQVPPLPERKEPVQEVTDLKARQDPARAPKDRRDRKMAAMELDDRLGLGSDYRNVRIINAGPGVKAWYRHEK